jgi:hypothetical protein
VAVVLVFRQVHRHSGESAIETLIATTLLALVPGHMRLTFGFAACVLRWCVFALGWISGFWHKQVPQGFELV